MTHTSARNRQRGHSIEVVDAKVAVDLATAQTYSENVFLFVPNLIGACACAMCTTGAHLTLGYSRILLAGLSLHFMSYHPKYCTLLYVVSCLLDAVDGQAARALNQTSKFGAVLDMASRWPCGKEVTHGTQLAGDGLEEPQAGEERREPDSVAVLQRLGEWARLGVTVTDGTAADTVLCVCGERAILRVSLPDEVDVGADGAARGAGGRDVCAGAGGAVLAGVGAEERDQRGAAVEGVEDPGGRGSGGAGGGAAGPVDK
ncbi:hypothetical protein C0993_011522 [Termitomyces sp. T159_Od127]|nr:hypothetical protein C0993_011522 [Termitomyces sp. T159_Od127]